MPKIDDVVSLGLGTAAPQPGWFDSLPLASPAAGQDFARVVPAELSDRLLTVTFRLTTSAVAGTRRPVWRMADGQNNNVHERQAGPPTPASSVVTSHLGVGMAADAVPGPSFQVDTSAAAPGAGGVVATLNIPTGEYNVTWIVDLAGAVAAADANNFALNLDGVQLVPSINPATAGTLFPQQTVQVRALAAGSVLTVTAIGAATAGTTYRAAVTAVPIYGGTYYGNIPDTIIRSGWRWKITILNSDAADQVDQIFATMWRYPTTALLPNPGG